MKRLIVFDSVRKDNLIGSRRPPVSCVLMTDVWWPETCEMQPSQSGAHHRLSNSVRE